MKKVVSTLLVIVIMLTALVLTSCEITQEMIDKYFATESTIITTITEEEWKVAFDSRNFTLRASLYTLDEDGNKVVAETMEMANTENSYGHIYNGEGQLIFVDEEGLITHLALTRDQGWVLAVQLHDTWAPVPSIGATMPTIQHYNFEDFTYDQSSKTYKATILDGKYSVELAFVDSKLVYLRQEEFETNIVTEVTNIGTTELVIPEYTILNK